MKSCLGKHSPEIDSRFVPLVVQVAAIISDNTSVVHFLCVFFFQTVCLTQHWKFYQRGVMGNRDAKSLSLVGILEVRACLE